MGTLQNHRLKWQMFLIQDRRCWLCGERMEWWFGPLRNGRKHPPPLAATWDHVLPVSHGGRNTQDNLMLAHSRCNQKRANNAEVRALRFDSK